jgi:cAMP-dependent protein kinase regulator
MAQEHQEYIQTKVNPTLENLVTQVLLERPENPVPFMIQWLAQQTKAATTLETGEAEKLRGEIRTLQTEVSDLEAKLGPAATSSSAPAAAAPQTDEKQAEEEEEEEEDDDDAPDEMPPPPAYTQKARASVSAEAYGDWNKVREFVPPVISKSEEQKARLSAVLKLTFLFVDLDKANLNIIIDAMMEKNVAADERIIQEGEDGDCMFVIEAGSIECLKKIDGADKVVKKIGAGDFFGELALLYNCPRAASVEARDSAVLWQLDRETFNHIVKDASMKKRETREKFINNVPLLQSLADGERKSLADSLHKESVAAGATVIKQGDVGDKFYLVETGELSVSKETDGVSKEVLKYSGGDYFGELSLLKNEARAASVIAITDCELLWLDTKTFKSLLGPIEDVMNRKAADYQP